MRPIVKSIKYTEAGDHVEYKPWRKAKPDLINEIGSYCSYCEKKVNRSALHIEHIFGKKVRNNAGDLIYDNLQFRWDNFLLACCNCNSVKDNKDVHLTNPYLPHLNNLVHFIEIVEGGHIQIKNGVEGDNLTRTKAFIDLVGLDREPSHSQYSNGDDRWENRLEAKDLAERYFVKYTAVPKQTDIETIINLAAAKGYFSIWYYQFLGYNEVVEALIKGTDISGKRIQITGTDFNSFKAPDYFTIERP
jgi:hypothetical protein